MPTLHILAIHGTRTFPLQRPIGIFTIDGTKNQAGQITHFTHARLAVDGHKRWTDFLVTDIGQEGLILGLPWLRKENPEVDWERGQLSIPKPKENIWRTKLSKEEKPEEESKPPLCCIQAN
jgi:hypothetical protein